MRGVTSSSEFSEDEVGPLQPNGPGAAGGRDVMWQEQVPGAAGQPHVTIEGGGHFIQEDWPDELVERMIAFIRGG